MTPSDSKEAETLTGKSAAQANDAPNEQMYGNPDPPPKEKDAAMEGRDAGEEEEDEEEGECGFCLFMKGGGCKDSFIAWEECIQEAEKNKEDIVSKCMDVTANLKKCMEAHAEYYEPILRAEKAAEEEAKQELEKEKAAEAKTDTAEIKAGSADQ